MDPLYVQINPRDNVGIVVNAEGVRGGARFASGLTAREAIPQSHKITLKELAPGEPVLRYGYLIGYANRAIPQGAWVREDLLDMPTAPPLDELKLATEIPEAQPALEGYTFEGYRNADGSAGTRNILGITTTVQCVAPTVDFAARRIREEILPRFPNVDDVVPITHTYGCGVAIDAPGAAVPIRTIHNISLNPNFGGRPLIVSLGCEKDAACAAVFIRSAGARRSGRNPATGRTWLHGNRRRDHAYGGENASRNSIVGVGGLVRLRT